MICFTATLKYFCGHWCHITLLSLHFILNPIYLFHCQSTLLLITILLFHVPVIAIIIIININIITARPQWWLSTIGQAMEWLHLITEVSSPLSSRSFFHHLHHHDLDTPTPPPPKKKRRRRKREVLYKYQQHNSNWKMLTLYYLKCSTHVIPAHSSPTAALVIALYRSHKGRREYHIISDSDTLLTERVLVALVPLK